MAAYYGKKKPLITDSNFNDTVFLLKTSSVQDNNTFLDSSSNNVAITRLGNVTQGAFSPFSKDPGYWSNYFDGSGDTLTIADNTALEPTNQSFCIEVWMYPTITGDFYWFGKGDAATASGSTFSFTRGTCSIYIGGASYSLSNGTAFITNQWNHYAICRSGTRISAFVNGARVSTNDTLGTGSLNNTANNITIGGYAGTILSGYLSNFRYVIGNSVYNPEQTTITVPTSPLTAIPGTALLTCQDHRFKDNSTNNFTITRNGDSKVSTFGPFSTTKKYDLATTGASAYINGAASPCGLSLTNNANLNFGLNDFTVEMWIYTNAAQNAFLLASHEGGISSGFYFYLTTTLFNLGGYLSGVGGFNAIVQPVYGSWNHIAWSRKLGTLKFFLNGVEISSIDASTWNYTGYPYNLSIGADVNGDETRFTGYISNMRIVNGTGVYSSNFTPPTSPVTAIPNTVFLLDFKNQGVYDVTGQNQIDTVNALSSNSITLFGKNTVYFDGTGDYLSVPADPMFTFGTGDFTIEAWIYLVSGTTGTIFDNRTGTTSLHPVLHLQNATTVALYVAGAGAIVSSSVTLTNNWTHVAVCKSNGITRLYINGVESGSSYADTNNYAASGTVLIGAGFGVANQLNGYISELRVTKGVNRYRQSFTVPTQSLTAITNTSLLTANDSTILDSSSNRFAITVNGDARTTVASPFAVNDGNYSVFFDGTGDSLSLGSAAANSPLDLTTATFTVESWVFVNSHAVDRDIFSSCATNVTGNSTVDFRLRITSTGVLDFATVSGSTGLSVLSSQTVPLNQWVHVAATRSGTSGSVFVNGQLTTGTVHSVSNTNRNIYVGSLGNTTYFNGYISNLRIVNGSTLYTGTFTVPSSVLTSTNDTILLACRDDLFKDSSSNNFAITPTGNTTTRRLSPFLASGSVYFDGTGDYVSTGYSSQLDITQGNFTIDVWIYPEQANGQIMVQRPSSGTAGWNFRLNSDSTVQFWYTGGTVFTTPAITLNRWTHLACVRNGTAYTTYVNGVSAASGTIANGVSVANTVNFYIGTNELVSGNFKGYISNARVVKGTAVYTSNFTLPTEPLTGITNTVLLTCQGSVIKDYSNNNIVSTFGNSSVIGFSPNDLGSLYFDGTGDWLTVPYNVNLVPGAGDFTIEMWFYTTNGTTRQDPYSIYTSTTGIGIALSLTNARDIVVYNGDTTLLATAGSVWTANIWNHLTVVRSGTTLRIFLNGTQFGTATNSTNITGSTNLYIGAAGNAAMPYTGYLSNVRFVKGTAVYTNNFTPPTLEYPIRGSTS